MFNGPDQQKEYEKFSENAKKEMAESLGLADKINLYSLKLNDLWEYTPTLKWDTTTFKEWAVQKDKIWNYVIINWIKCREYQPWISWFVYQDIRSRYYPEERLRIWFCDRWKFKKSITIDSSFGPKKVNIIPQSISRKLWWPFYEVEDINTIKKWPLHDIKWEDIFYTKEAEDELIKSELKTKYKEDVIQENDSKTLLKIKWITFKEHTPWSSWFLYKEFTSPYGEQEDYLLLGEYKNWKMVWEWIIITSTRKIYIITSNNQIEE